MKLLSRSFAGGEVAPELFGRIDLGKFQTGLRLARNFLTRPHGPAARRPGFQFIGELDVDASTGQFRKCRLIPFVYSATSAVIVQLGEQYARFYTKTGPILETGKNITAITQAAIGQLTIPAHGFTSGDWVYLSGIGGMVELNARTFEVAVVDANTIRIQEPSAATYLNTTSYTAYTAGGTAARLYTVTTPWPAATLADLSFTQDADTLTICSASYPATELKRISDTNWTVTSVSFTPTLAAPTAVTCTATKPTPTNPVTQTYVVTSVASDLVTESAASATASDTNNLSIFGNYNTITWAAAVGAARYYVYRKRGGSFGYIGQTTGTSFIDDNILPDTTQTPPENFTTLNTGVSDYPACATHFEQRRWFAGTFNALQAVWATRSATLSNLTSSVPSRDDDALSFRIRAQQQNAIRYLVPLVDLVALTVGGEFRIFADPGPAITPSSLSTKGQSFAGAARVQPVLTPASALYVQAQGSRVRELAYVADGTGSYRSTDVTLFAPHLFTGYSITELAFSRAPDQTLWAVRSDGKMLGLTYVPEQQVYGWCQHDTHGLIESVAVIPENDEDVLYVVVQRKVNGTLRRYLERLQTRRFNPVPTAAFDASGNLVFTAPGITSQANAFYVDSGLTYSGAATTTLTNLWHLEGRKVQVLADGAVHPEVTVSGGRITLQQAASVVQVGLGYQSDLQTLPAVFEMEAMGQGTMKNVSKVYLRVAQSALVKAGPSFDKLAEYPARAVSDPWGSPPALRDGELALSIAPNWSTDGSVCVRQDQPLPLTVLALTLDTVAGG